MNLYETNDLGLASALSCLGFNLMELNRRDPRRVIFCFSRQQGDLEKAVQSYWDNSLRLPPAQLFTHQKLLKQRLYADRP